MAKKKLLDLSMLIHYSTKIKEYITGKIEEVNVKIEDVSKKVEEDKVIINAKVDSNTNQIVINKDNITGLDNKYTVLEQTVNGLDLSCDGHPDGDIINVNSIEQYTFRNIKAGDVIEIPNTTGCTDFIVECFADMSVNNTIDHKVILLDSNNRENFICDERYVDVTPTGLKPKDNVVLDYTGEILEIGNDVFEIFTSEIIGEDVIDRILDIISVEEI